MENVVVLSEEHLNAIAAGDDWHWVYPKGQDGRDLPPIAMGPFGPVDPATGIPLGNPD